MMELHQLQSFCKVAGAGSLTVAAEGMSITQAALSRQMAALERALGARLFRRTGRGLQLTEAGERLLEHAPLILQHVAQAERAVRGDAAKARGSFALGLPPSLARTMVVPLVDAFAAQLPGVALRCLDGLSANLVELVAGGKLDCAVVYGDAGIDAVQRRLLAQEDLYLVSGPNGKPSLGKAVGLAQIATLPLIVSGAHNAVHLALEEALGRIGGRAQVVHEIANLNAILDLVRAGRGYSVIPMSGVYSCIEDPLLKLHRIRRPALKCPLHIALPTAHQGDPVIDEVLRMLERMAPVLLAEYTAEVEAAIVRWHSAAAA
jgi:LysR family nitrogen assimilation transcriptional regulator